MSPSDSAHLKLARAEVCGCMNRKGRQTLRNYQVLRADASPRGVNCIGILRRGSHGFAGLAPHSGRSSRPRSLVLCSGEGRLPFHHQAQRPQDNRVSIGKTITRVNLIHLWKIERPVVSCPGRGIEPGPIESTWFVGVQGEVSLLSSGTHGKTGGGLLVGNGNPGIRPYH
jgi:hypothetical protein